MGFETQIESFVADKRDFFASVKTIEEAKKRAYDGLHNYEFVASNEKFIRDDVYLLLNRLKEDKVNQEIFWFYCYSCCIMLQNFHLIYDGHNATANKFLELRLQIKKRCATGIFPADKANNDSFITYLVKQISDALADLISTPFHTSKIKNKLAYVNVVRIYWFFCRTLISKSLNLFRDWDWINKINSTLDMNIDVDNIISTLEMPTAFLRGFSVGFFILRFIINMGTLIKHVCFPTKEEKKLDWKKRFANEVYKRHGDLLNDLVWGLVNLVANYNSLFGIADPTAGWVIVGFLVFDLALIVWRRYLAHGEYLEKRLQLTKDLEFYQAKLRIPLDLSKNLSNMHEERMMHEEQCRLLTQEIKDFDLAWQAKDATFWFNGTAALLLVVGFSASMVLSSPVVVLACYAICTFAVAMYLSADAYTPYKEKSLILYQAQIEEKNVDNAMEEYLAARNEFIWTMVKNAIMPTLAITLYAVCWQAALVLTAIVICYQLYSAYNTYSKSQEVKVEEAVEDSEEELGLVASLG
ncbi:MAG: hypothetical protein H0U73_11800 [Tatlockia sp.]|nr:hypothetical protein [Tatlockia sp.]